MYSLRWRREYLHVSLLLLRLHTFLWAQGGQESHVFVAELVASLLPCMHRSIQGHGGRDAFHAGPFQRQLLPLHNEGW
jgi:hypothetical protein